MIIRVTVEFPVSSNKSGHSPLTSLINKSFLLTEPMLTGCFFCFSYHSFVCENSSRKFQEQFLKYSSYPVWHQLSSYNQSHYDPLFFPHPGVWWWFYELSSWHMIGWLDSWLSMCTGVSNKVASDCIYKLQFQKSLHSKQNIQQTALIWCFTWRTFFFISLFQIWCLQHRRMLFTVLHHIFF